MQSLARGCVEDHKWRTFLEAYIEESACTGQEMVEQSVQNDFPYFISYDEQIRPGNYKILIKTSYGDLE